MNNHDINICLYCRGKLQRDCPYLAGKDKNLKPCLNCKKTDHYITYEDGWHIYCRQCGWSYSDNMVDIDETIKAYNNRPEPAWQVEAWERLLRWIDGRLEGWNQSDEYYNTLIDIQDKIEQIKKELKNDNG